MDYAWDPIKATSNIQKHNVSFEEAQSVFDDPMATVFEDEKHSEIEVREFIVGHSNQNRLLLVCFTQRQDGIRLFSARHVTRFEREDYENSK